MMTAPVRTPVLGSLPWSLQFCLYLDPQPVLCRRARPCSIRRFADPGRRNRVRCTSVSCELARRADWPRYRNQRWFGV